MDLLSDQDLSTNQQDSLDVEYRQILRIIKPYIQTINNNCFLAQYRIWLEKLSETKDNEKLVRNQYLMELARQIQCKDLAVPFTQMPPVGVLPKLNTPWKAESPDANNLRVENPMYCVPKDLEIHEPVSFHSKQMMCQEWAKNIDNLQQLQFNKSCLSPRRPWPYHAVNQNVQISKEDLKQDMTDNAKAFEENPKRKVKSVNCRRVSLLQGIDENVVDKLIEPVGCVVSQYTNKEVGSSPQSKIKTVEFDQDLRNVSQLQNECGHQEKLFMVAEENSWCDLTEASTTSLAVLASGDSDKKGNFSNGPVGHKKFETQIDNLIDEIKGLKQNNMFIKGQGEISNTSNDDTIGTILTNKMDNLKELNEVKHALKDANFIASDWKKTVESLQVRLTETQTQNKEMSTIIQDLEKKIYDVELSRNKEFEDLKKSVTEKHSNEMENIKENHATSLKTLEVEFKNKLREAEENFQTKLTEIEARYVHRNDESSARYEKVLKEKEMEIRRLEEIIQKQCTRLINEINGLRNQIETAANNNNSNDERILFLQKCITKMDKLFQRSEREYSKQIDKLKQELDSKEKTTQIQLQTHRAEIIAKCSTEKQAELDTIVENLETRYAKLLQLQQTQNLISKTQADEVIQGLKQILEKHGIPY